MLAEVTATAISRNERPDNFAENRRVARDGGKVAKNARQDIETRLGKTVISSVNARDKKQLEITLPKKKPIK